jgi:hypothetical protein
MWIVEGGVVLDRNTTLPIDCVNLVIIPIIVSFRGVSLSNGLVGCRYQQVRTLRDHVTLASKR